MHLVDDDGIIPVDDANVGDANGVNAKEETMSATYQTAAERQGIKEQRTTGFENLPKALQRVVNIAGIGGHERCCYRTGDDGTAAYVFTDAGLDWHTIARVHALAFENGWRMVNITACTHADNGQIRQRIFFMRRTDGIHA